MRIAKMIVAALVGALVLVSCGPLGLGGGTLLLHLHGADSARTLTPPLLMEIASYDVSGSGPGGETFEQLGIVEDATVVTGLTPGIWSVSVEGRNPDGIIVASGEASVEVLATAVASATITLTPLDGDGWLELSLQWPIDVLDDPSVEAHLVAGADDQLLGFDLLADGSGAVYPDPEDPPNTNLFGSGYYLLTLKMFDGANQVWDWVEAVRILADQTTTGDYELQVSQINEGSLELIIEEDLQNPIDIELSGALSNLLPGTSMTVTATTSESVDSYQWFLNGDPIAGATEPSVTVGGGLANGTYRLVLLVSSGAVLSSEGVQFIVAPPMELEWQTQELLEPGYVSAEPAASSLRIDTQQHASGAVCVAATADVGHLIFCLNESIGDVSDWQRTEPEEASAFESTVSVDTGGDYGWVVHNGSLGPQVSWFGVGYSGYAGTSPVGQDVVGICGTMSIAALDPSNYAVLLAIDGGVALSENGGTAHVFAESGELASNRSMATGEVDPPQIVFLDSGDLCYALVDGPTVTPEVLGTGYDWATIAVGPDEHPYICARDGVVGQLVLFVSDGAGWDVEPLTPTGSAATEAALAISESGVVHMCYRDGLLTYMVGSPADWSTYLVAGGVEGHLPAIDVDPLGYVHISCWDAATGRIVYATNRPE